MDTVEIAGIKVPRFSGTEPYIFPSTLVETETVTANLRKILYPLLDSLPVLLVGDAGVGKNALVYHINFLRNKPTLRFSFNEDTLPEDLIGSYRIDPTGKGFLWENGPITEALQTGTSFVADEMNLTSPLILKRFASIFEARYLDLLEGSGERVFAKNGFDFVGTQNPQEGFEGRKPLPIELTKHFAVVYMDPYSPDELQFIFKKLYPSLEEELIKKCIRFCLESDRAILLGNIGKGDLEKYHFNMRTLKKLFSRFQHFKTIDEEICKQQLYSLFIQPFRKKEDRTSQEELAKSIFQTSFTEEKIFPSFSIANNEVAFSEFTIKTENESKSLALVKSNPLPGPIRKMVREIAVANLNQENILIEYREDQSIEAFLPILTDFLGKEIKTIYMSKGIHTSDILGSLKPTSANLVDWIDGPLTSAIKEKKSILLKGLESCGAELVEKLNMLTDDAKSITLPPESGFSRPITLAETSVVFATKTMRVSKTTPTISRAFRNRFTPILFPELEDKVSLQEILEFYLPQKVSDLFIEFHLKVKDLSNKRVIGSSNLSPYNFGVSNLLQWKNHVYNYNAPDVKEILFRGGCIAYTNQISDSKERKELERILDFILQGVSVDSELFEKIEEKKKTFTKSSDVIRKPWWDPELHKRDPITGKAEKKNSGKELKKGQEINTPPTGGTQKEGADAWYGSETQGNGGQGEPAGGGGAWGYRTEELYQQFLKKRKILWDYSIQVTLEEFKKEFGSSLESVEMNLERLFDPEIDITRLYKREGLRVDARKFIAFQSGKGDSKIFDKTIIDKNEEKLKGVEIAFLLSKCRRIFNFDYSISTITAIVSSSYILQNHDVKFSIHTFSDLHNTKKTINLNTLKKQDEDFSGKKEEEVFYSLVKNWQGDTISDYQILEDAGQFFSNEAQTKIIVLISDFRGQRAKTYPEDELASFDTKKLKESLKHLENRNIVTLGVGMGSRYHASSIFHDHLQITEENFYNMPNLLGSKLSSLILTHHTMRN